MLFCRNFAGALPLQSVDILFCWAHMMAFFSNKFLAGQAVYKLRSWAWKMALVFVGCVLSVPPSFAVPPAAGTVITAKALANYTLPGNVSPETIMSNTVIAVIQPVEALKLTSDNNFQRPAASPVSFPHVLTNTGNVTSTYSFAVDSTGCATPNLNFQSAPVLYVDVNGNGVVDAGDRKLTVGNTGVLTLVAGEWANLVLQAQIPLAPNGGKSCARLVATADVSGSKAQSLDTVVVTSNASLVLNKSVTYSGLAIPGVSLLNYTINANNIGNNAAQPSATLPTASTILVNGLPRAVVLIRDPVPTGAQYVAGSLHTAVSGALRLFRLASDAPFSYHSEPAPVGGVPTGRDDSTAVEVAIGIPQSLPPTTSVSMDFQARLLSNAGALVDNTAWANFNDGASPAESVSNTVGVKTTSEVIGLSKAAGVPAANVDANGTADGTATVRFQLQVRNFGSGTLYNVGMSDPLENAADGLGQYTAEAIPGTGKYTVVANSVRLVSLAGAGTAAVAASNFTGQSGHAELLGSGALMPPGGAITVQFDVRFNLTGVAATLFNSATAHAATASDAPDSVSAKSSNGVDPDANHDGIPDTAARTPFSAQLPVLNLLKTVSPTRPVAGLPGSYDMDIALKVTNVSLVGAPNVRLADNLFCAFEMDKSSGPIESWKITVAAKSQNGLLTPSSTYTGGHFCDRIAQANPDNLASFPFDFGLTVVDGTRALASGESETIKFTVRVKLKPAAIGTLVTVNNRAWAGVVRPLTSDATSLPGYNNGQVELLWATSSTANVTMVDPSGVVYNAVTRQPVANAVVTLTRLACPGLGSITAAQLFGDSSIYTFNADGSVAQTTDANGAYSFIFKVPPVNELCTYTLKVTPPSGSSLVYPSSLLPAHAGTFENCGPVSAIAAAPAAGDDVTYYSQVRAGLNTTTGLACEVFNNNIPLDPSATTGLTLQKTANPTTVEVGDVVSFTLKVANLTNVDLPQLAIRDQLPVGFRYVVGSTRIGGVRVVDPVGGVGPNLVFNLPLSASSPLAAGQSQTLTYQVRVGASTPIGVDSINRAWANAGSDASALTSNEADARVRILGGVFASDAYAFGKVFMDCNKNGIQDEAEWGIPGVRLFMEDGTGVVTDIEGKWSLYGLRPVTHALRLDTSTLPSGAQLALIEPRQSRQADSVFMDLKNGEWHKANFAVQNCENSDLIRAVQARRDAIIAQPASEGEAVRASTRLTTDGKVVIPTDVRGLPSAGSVDASGSMKTATVVSSPLITLPGAVGASDFAAVPNDSSAGLPLPYTSGGVVAPATVAAPEQIPLEDTLQNLDRTLGFLNLSDKQVLLGTLFNVRVKGSQGSRLVLAVNDQIVDEKRVGKRASVENQQLEAWEYISVQFRPGVNALRVQEVDAFGNVRARAEIQVIAPGPLAQIAIEVAATAKADESSRLPVKIRLLDAQGIPVTERTQLTLESIATRWNVTDSSPLEPGVQVMVEGGSAVFDLVPPANPGDGKIRVSAGTVQSESRVVFLPDLRPLTGIGVLQGVVNIRDLGRMPLGAPRASDAFESELRGWVDKNSDTLLTTRTAFYFKGAVKGEYLLTAAYDSDKNTATTLFRDIQPDQFYPVYGDSAVKTFDAQSSQRFYVRIDKNRSYLLFGDYNTASSPEVRKLSQMGRTATGLQHVYNTEDVRVTSHFSRDSLKQVIEEFPANGTSGPFTLNSAGSSDLFANSETVLIVVRDRSQPNSILSTTPLNRFVDYSIEPISKRILFTKPISSLDANLNPQSIRITYLVDTGGPEFDIAGTDIQLRVSDRLQLGAVAEYDASPNASRKLLAATALAKLDANTVLSAELVGTQSDLKGYGEGLGLELRHDDTLLKYNLHVQISDSGFDNPSAAINSGHAEARGHLDYQLSTDTHLKADLVYTQDNNLSNASGGISSASQTQGLSVAVQTKISPNVTAEVGLRSGQTDTSAATTFDYGSVSAGAPASSTSNVTGVKTETLSVRGRLTVNVPDVPNTQVYVEAEQDVNNSHLQVAAIGGNYAINDKARVYGRYELISSLGSEYALTNGMQRNVGLVGVESAYMKGGRVYDEYRIADTMDGRAMQSALGIRNTYEVDEGLRLSGGLEQVSALPGATGTASGASRAITGAFDWLGTGEYKKRLRGSGSVEFRDGSDATSGLLALGIAYKLDPDWSMLTRGTINQVNSRTDGSLHWLEREQIGFAYRPVDQDVWNTLLRYEHKSESWGGVASSTFAPATTLTDIVSAHLNYQSSRSDILSARVAAKQNTTTVDGVRSNYGAQLLYGRWTHDISLDWDFGLQAGLMLGDGNMQQQTLGAEAGYQLSKGLWLSMGYNFLGLHDPDLVGADYTDSGVYVRLRFKFDERLFKSEAPAAADLR